MDTTHDTQPTDVLALLMDVSALSRVARRHLKGNMQVQDTLDGVRNLNYIESFICDELEEQYTGVHTIARMFQGSGDVGMQAVGDLVMVHLLQDAPDLVQLAITRACDSLQQIVFGGCAGC